MAKPRVLFYSHDGLGLGHLRISLAVAEALTRRVPRAALLLLTAQPAVSAFALPQRLDYVRMPALDKREIFQSDPGEEPGAPADVFDLRRAVIAAAIESFAPHMVVVDHNPVGLAGELLPVLRRPPVGRQPPLFVLGLRDITYGPERTRQEWARTGAYEVMERVYDMVLIYGSPRVFDPIREYELAPAIARKAIFTGYLHRAKPAKRAQKIRRELGATEAPLVVVSAGGGLDGAAIIETLLTAVRDGLLPGVVTSAVAGPQMPASDVARLTVLAAPLTGVTFVQFRNDLDSHVAAADVVVTMGGYNSVWEAVGAGKRPIIIPRQGGSDEQPLRAERLAALGLATVISGDELTPATLAAAVNAELTRGVTPAIDLDFGGSERAAEALAALLGC